MHTNQPSLEEILHASARASALFASSCLEPHQGNLRAKSSFVDPWGNIMHWHEFGDLEGPGWAANALGGALLLFRWAEFTTDLELKKRALALLDHVLQDGFIDPESGFIYPYYEIAQKRFCLNYTHNDQWLCPGSLAKIGTQLLEFSDLLAGDPRAETMQASAGRLAKWIMEHTPLLPSGWVPRRITMAGQAYPHSPTGGADPIFDHSADGLFLLELYAALAARGMQEYLSAAVALGDAFVNSGGWWGSINHDTYDDHENVAYSVAYRVLCHHADSLGRPHWKTFAREQVLPALERFRMHEDRHGVATKGLLWMEDTWDTAYLWENAEAAHAYLEDWASGGKESHREAGLAILRAIANHHYGPGGFLTEGVDWNNHVSRRHHVREALYGAINYTEPLLNHLYHLGPALFYFEQVGYKAPASLDDQAAIDLMRQVNIKSQPPVAGGEGARYLLRLYYPAIETNERLEKALDFAQRAGVDGVLLFEASFDMDPALLTQAALEARFERLKGASRRFRQAQINGKPIEVHINMMITLGHVDSGCAQPEKFSFQFLVDEFGNVSRSSACPLDPDFLARTERAYQLAGECEVDAVWVDDDTRLLYHDLPGTACFCPHHLDAMAQKTGRRWEREELAAALQAAQEGASTGETALRSAWLDVQEDAVLRLAGVIEKAVHGAAPDTRVGLMTVGTMLHAAEGRRTDALLRVLAGSTRPLIRPGSGFWNDWQPAGIIDKSEDCARQISFLGPDVQAVAEVENHPYSPYLKSNRVLALELALDVLAGMPDLSLNILTSMGGSGPLEPEGTDYAHLLVEQRPFLDALAREWAGKVRRGIGIACSEDSARRSRSPKKGQQAWVEPRPWELLLARLGLPIGRPDQGPHWISGETAWALTRGEWGQYLREGAVLDPIAAQVLLDRGLAGGLGLRGITNIGEAVNEQNTDDPINAGRAGWMFPAYNHVPYHDLFGFEVVPGAGRNVSRWVNVDGQDRGPACVLVEGKHGRAGLLPYRLRSAAGVLLQVSRREQWANILEWASGKPLPCRVTNGVNLYPLAFQSPDHQSWLVAAANLSVDDMQGAKIRLGFEPNSISRLSAQGEWGVEEFGSGPELEFDLAAFSLSAWRIK